MLWLCHTLQFAFMLTVFSNLTQYYVYVGHLKRRPSSHLFQYGPAYCVFFASILLMVHPTLFLLRDVNLKSDICDAKVAYASTYIGFFLLIYACAWATEAISSLRRA
eukprot:GEMP01060687.1.p3 GENE.GEMP01060687.1~~GEMP01060687.1.p3  ORF type:complete len:107 (+),score=18.06 GEMP01060687.1:470-790(+)